MRLLSIAYPLKTETDSIPEPRYSFRADLKAQMTLLPSEIFVVRLDSHLPLRTGILECDVRVWGTLCTEDRQTFMCRAFVDPAICVDR